MDQRDRLQSWRNRLRSVLHEIEGDRPYGPTKLENLVLYAIDEANAEIERASGPKVEAPELCLTCGGTREHRNAGIGNWHGPPGSPCDDPFHDQEEPARD